MYSLHLRELCFNRGFNDKSLINPRLYTRLKKDFLVSSNIHLLFERFRLLHLREPFCKGNRLHGPFYFIVLLLYLACLCF